MKILVAVLDGPQLVREYSSGHSPGGAGFATESSNQVTNGAREIGCLTLRSTYVDRKEL